jgi:hypothetical protein
MESWKQKRDRQKGSWKSQKPERDRIWYGTMKRQVSASESAETVRNHSSSSIAVTTGNASSESGQPQYGRFREPAGGRRSYVQQSTGATIQSTTIANAKRLRIASAKRLSLWKASFDLSLRPSRTSHSHQLRATLPRDEAQLACNAGHTAVTHFDTSLLLLSSYAATTFAASKGRLNHIELPTRSGLMEGIKGWPLVPSLSARNAVILVNLHNFPTGAICDLP